MRTYKRIALAYFGLAVLLMGMALSYSLEGALGDALRWLTGIFSSLFAVGGLLLGGVGPVVARHAEGEPALEAAAAVGTGLLGSAAGKEMV